LESLIDRFCSCQQAAPELLKVFDAITLAFIPELSPDDPSDAALVTPLQDLGIVKNPKVTGGQPNIGKTFRVDEVNLFGAMFQ
jgi:hypothetical protein